MANLKVNGEKIIVGVAREDTTLLRRKERESVCWINQKLLCSGLMS